MRLLILFLFFIVIPAGGARGETSSFWGGPGLTQIPTARTPDAGVIAAGLAADGRRLAHVSVGAAITPWLWVNLRQTAYPNDWGLLEPGVDATLRLAPEGPMTPAVAVGWRDALGSGLHLPGIGRFSGEYLAFSKRWWSLDFTAGLGWGRLAGRAAAPNPLSWGRRERPETGPSARGPRNWFSGRDVGVFGGVAWRTPLDGLTLTLEYSPDDYTAERRDDPFGRQPSPFIVGAAWRPFPQRFRGLEIAAATAGGKDVMLRTTVRLYPDMLKFERPGPPPAVPKPRSRAGKDLEAALPSGPFRDASPLFGERERTKDKGAPAEASADGTISGATLWLNPAFPPNTPLGRDIGRGLRHLAGAIAPDAEWLAVAVRPDGLNGPAATVPRDALLRAADGRGSAEELWRAARIAPAAEAGVPPVGAWAWRGFSARLRLAWEESLFEQGASGVMRAYGDLETAWTPYPGVMLGAHARKYGANTLAGLNNWLWIAEKPVRSDLPLYMLDSGVERLHLSWRRSLGADWHVGFDAGWLEEMYAGFGGEILHQPFGARWAAGGSVYRAWKRPPWDYFRVDYANDATQALAAAHYEGAGGDWTASLEAGRYLGGDWGGGAYFTRRLPGEASLTAHAVWTNGPLAQHAQLGGKGEYGLRLSVPLGGLGAAALRYITGADQYALPLRIDAAVGTLGRDAGQKLNRPAQIYDRLSAAGFGRLTGTWDRLLE